MSDVRAAAEALLDKLHQIINSDEYMRAMNAAALHGAGYVGPSAGEEMLNLRIAIAEYPAEGPSDSEMLDWLESQELLQVNLNDDAGTVLIPPLRDAIRQAMGGGT